MPTLKTGALAYYDSFAGLVKCKVLAIDSDGIVDYVVTANKGPYRRGEHCTSNGLHVIPRDAVRFRKFGSRILPFDIERS